MDVNAVSTGKMLLERGGTCSVDRFESFLNKIQDLLKDYCEFRSVCPYFDLGSHSCTMTGGGSYCGKHRILKQKKEKTVT